MSSPYVSVELQAQVLADAGHRCGYCHSVERLTGMTPSTEHLIPRVAGGPTVRENLWRSCRACNEQKGAQLQAVDPETGETVPLYNPRLQTWNAHSMSRYTG
jgi:5-methylcytosine-specific restriction endonuclease McrA